MCVSNSDAFPPVYLSINLLLHNVIPSILIKQNDSVFSVWDLTFIFRDVLHPFHNMMALLDKQLN